MGKIAKIVNDHHEFLKNQAERYALCTAFLTAGFLCLKYMEKLFYVAGIVSGLCLLAIALALFSNNISVAEEYVSKNFAPKKTLKFGLIGAVYGISVICIGYSLLFEAVAK